MGRHREFNVDDVLDGAMGVFWRDGYAGAAIGDICEVTGLNPGSVYGAFGNKRGLFLAVIHHYLEQVNQPGIDILESNASGLGGIRAYFEHIVEGIVHNNRRWGCLGTNAFMELKESDDEVARIFKTHFSHLAKVFETALERDGVENAAIWAQHLLCVAQGLNVLAKTDPDISILNAVVETTTLAIGQSSVAA